MYSLQNINDMAAVLKGTLPMESLGSVLQSQVTYLRRRTDGMHVEKGETITLVRFNDGEDKIDFLTAAEIAALGVSHTVLYESVV